MIGGQLCYCCRNPYRQWRIGASLKNTTVIPLVAGARVGIHNPYTFDVSDAKSFVQTPAYTYNLVTALVEDTPFISPNLAILRIKDDFTLFYKIYPIANVLAEGQLKYFRKSFNQLSEVIKQDAQV